MTQGISLRGLLAVTALLAMAACAHDEGVRNNAATRAADRVAGSDVSGAYPSQHDGMPGNPPGTAASRAFDRAAGTDVSGAYPAQRDGTVANPPGTAATRTYDRTTGSNVSGAYPQNNVR